MTKKMSKKNDMFFLKEVPLYYIRRFMFKCTAFKSKSFIRYTTFIILREFRLKLHRLELLQQTSQKKDSREDVPCNYLNGRKEEGETANDAILFTKPQKDQ